MRSVVNAFGSVVTRVEIFGTEMDFRLTIITCDVLNRYFSIRIFRIKKQNKRSVYLYNRVGNDIRKLVSSPHK